MAAEHVPPVHSGVGLPWLAVARWATVAAQLGAALMGAVVLHVQVRWPIVAGVLAITIASNAWLTRRVRTPGEASALAGRLIVLDVVGLAAVLYAAGGPLNPVSIYFLVQITQAAFVHGARVATLVAAVATTLDGLLFVVVPPDLQAALAMHPEVARHFQGMWWAFAATAALVTTFVVRLATAVAQRDADLHVLESRLARTETLRRLGTQAADAAHELGTPLATIALTAGELERDLAKRAGDLAGAIEDVRLIREESHRCRAILDDMAGRAGQPIGGEPTAASVADIVGRALGALPPARARAVRVSGATDIRGVWPVDALARALVNVIRNAFDASPPAGTVDVHVRAEGPWLRLDVTDTGTGMTRDVLARLGEPFFTTKPGTGHGLGLVVVRSTLELIGGRLDVRSVAGQGTCMTLVVPLEATP